MSGARQLDPNVRFDDAERVAAEKIDRETVSYMSNIYKHYGVVPARAGECIQRRDIKKNAASH